MSVFDRFLSAIKLNDDDDLDDDDYFDEEDDDIDDSRPSRRLLRTRDEEDTEPELTSYSSRSSESLRRRTSVSEKPKRQAKVSAFRPRKMIEPEEDGNNNFAVCVIRPKSMEDALSIAQTLIAKCTIILNLEGLDLDVSQRIFDFASGACCASKGRLDKISNYIFVLTPNGVEITGEFQEILTGAFDPDIELDLDD